MSKDVDGIEANFQIAFWKKNTKKIRKGSKRASHTYRKTTKTRN